MAAGNSWSPVGVVLLPWIGPRAVHPTHMTPEQLVKDRGGKQKVMFRHWNPASPTVDALALN